MNQYALLIIFCLFVNTFPFGYASFLSHIPLPNFFAPKTNKVLAMTNPGAAIVFLHYQ